MRSRLTVLGLAVLLIVVGAPWGLAEDEAPAGSPPAQKPPPSESEGGTAPQDPAPADPAPSEGSQAEEVTPPVSFLPSGQEPGEEPFRPGETATISLSLEEAVQIALANSFAVRLARIDRDIQRQQETIERAAFDPTVSAQGEYARNRPPSVDVTEIGAAALLGDVQTNENDFQDFSLSLLGRTTIGTQYTIRVGNLRTDQPVSFDGNVIGLNPQYNISASVEVTQPLLRGGWRSYNRSRVRIARNNQDIADTDLQLAAIDFVYEVEVAYWQLSFALKNYEARLKALETAQENYENVRQSNLIGARSDSDVVIAQSQLSLRKVEYSEAQVLLYNSRDRLLVLLNQEGMETLRETWGSNTRIRPFNKVWVTPVSEPSTVPMVPTRDQAYDTAFTTRPDYQRVVLEMENQKIQLDVARNELLPRLDARGRWTQLGLDDTFNSTLDSIGDGRFYNWSVGLELSFPLGNRAERNRHLQSISQMDQLRLRKAQIENQIFTQIDQTIRNLVSLFERVNDLDTRVRLQRDLLDKEREKLEVGRTTYYNVSVIENDLVDSETEALRAKVEYEAAKADYYRVTGTLLQRRGSRDFPEGR